MNTSDSSSNTKYKENKTNYIKLKNQTSTSFEKNQIKRGLLIQAPMGTGKSYWIKNLVPENKKDIFLDGDELLDKLGIKNRNYFWYDSKSQLERQTIINAFEKYLANGYFILYSGNPNLMQTDVIIHIDPVERKKRVSDPGRFNPSDEQFNREESAYIEAIENTKSDSSKTANESNDKNIIVIEGDIPDVSILEKLRDSKYQNAL